MTTESKLEITVDPANMYPRQTILGQTLAKLALAIDKQTEVSELKNIFHTGALASIFGRHHYAMDPGDKTVMQLIDDVQRSAAIRNPDYIDGLANRGLSRHDYARDVHGVETDLEALPRRLETLCAAIGRTTGHVEVDLVSSPNNTWLAESDIKIMGNCGFRMTSSYDQAD